MTEKCEVYRLGRMPYDQAWSLQETWAGEIARGERPPALLLLEHPHTFTFGRKGHAENLVWDEAECKRRGVNVYWVDRGGDVTYHGPGQLVGYPLLPLTVAHSQTVGADRSIPRADYVGYLRRLEDVLIQASASLGLVAGILPGLTGVWVQPEVHSRCRRCPPELRRQPAKLAAIGVKVDAHGVTRHGFALNVNPDMTYWDGIIGCGLKGLPITCLADLLDPLPDFTQVMDRVEQAFEKEFGFRLTPGELVGQ